MISINIKNVGRGVWVHWRGSKNRQMRTQRPVFLRSARAFWVSYAPRQQCLAVSQGLGTSGQACSAQWAAPEYSVCTQSGNEAQSRLETASSTFTSGKWKRHFP